MGSKSMRTISNPVFQSKIPIFDETLLSTGLSKPPNMSGLFGRPTLQYSGAYIAYDPTGKDGARFIPSWSNSKTGITGQNHIIYRKDSTSADESHRHSSSSRHSTSNQSFMLYAKSPEVSSPADAVSGGIRKQKSGCENSPSHSENSIYLAIPKPVYRHPHCCNELDCVIGPPYSVEQSNPSISNTVHEREWMQSAAHYNDLSPVQRKAAHTLLQQRGLQIDPSEDPLKRINAGAYSPGRTRTLPAIIEPIYSSYPCAPTRSLFSSLSEHSQSLQSPQRGYPGPYSSHPTYERLTSEVYQEHSPMSKYGQVAQHPVFYYPQANVEGENRAQCKDSGNKKREDDTVIHKHQIAHPQEHCIVPQSHLTEIPFPRTEMLPTYSFMHGFEYPCYAVPQFNFDPSQIRSQLKRQHVSNSLDSSCINVSPSGQHRHLPVATATSPHNNKPMTSLCVDQLKASSPFLLMDQKSPNGLLSKPCVSPGSIPIGRFFSSFTGMHLDPAVFSPAGLNRDKHVDYASYEAYQMQAKSLPVPPAGWKPQTPSHDSERLRTAGPGDAMFRKLFFPVASTVNRKSDSMPNSQNAGHKNDLKRKISQATPPIKIKEEAEDLHEVKKQKMSSLQENVSNYPHMPVIDRVFSLAPYLHASRNILPSEIPQRRTQSPDQPEVKPTLHAKEETPDGDEQDPVEVAAEEIQSDTVIQKVQNMKVEKEEPSEIDPSEETCAPHTNYNEVIIKKEICDGDRSDSEATPLKKMHESDKQDTEPPSAAQNTTPEETKPTVLPLVNSPCLGDAHSQLGPTSLHLIAVKMPQVKIDLKNIPSQCLKFNRYNTVLRDGTQSSSAILPPETPLAQPIPEPGPKSDIDMPVRKHFFVLHHSLCKLLSKSVSASSEQKLKNWLSQLQITEPKSPSTKVQQVSCLLGAKTREEWINEELKLALNEILQRLNEYNAQERCPFPHVYRTGAVFLPMLVVKELLFPMVQGSFIDQVLQEHKVGLRPTTLSEEKILIQLHKRACSSRLRRLMALKHLPGIYIDMVNILYYTYVCKHLEPTSPDVQKQVQNQVWSQTVESKT